MRDGLRGMRSPWYATTFVAVGALLSLAGFDGFVTYGAWIRSCAEFVAVIAFAVVVVRMTTRSRALPSIVGVLATVLLAVPAFARDDAGARLWLPSPANLRIMAGTLSDAVAEAGDTVAPADVTRPLLALITASVVLVFLVAEHLAVSWRASATAGMVLLLPWVPAIALQHRVSTRALLAAIASWVIMLALTRKPTGSVHRPSALAAITATGATLGLVALVVPTALGGPGWGMIPRIMTPTNLDGTTQLNLDLDLRNSLTVNPSSPVLVYVSSADKPSALRTHTFTHFDGTAWSRDNDPGTKAGLSSVLWPVVVSGFGQSGQLTRLSFQLVGFQGNNLPLPTAPRTVEVAGDFHYFPKSDEVVTDTESLKDLKYSTDVDLGFLNEDTLKSAGRASQQDDTLDPSTLEIPAGVDAARFRALAQQLTAGASTRYDQALALQEYFRDENTFTYDPTVSPSGSDSVSVFLDDKRGYCVQFATSMVMLARSLGIPARLAIGFLPGTSDGQGAFVVRGGDAHAWPELYFATIGWVRFEPTPSVQTGARPSYATPANAPAEPEVKPTTTPAPVNPTGGANPVFSPTTEPTATPVTPPAAASDTSPVPMLATVFAIVVLALLVAWWLRRRSVTAAAASAGVETEWNRLRLSLPDRLTWSPTLTPLEAASAVNAAAVEAGLEWGAGPLAALEQLAAAVSDVRYAPSGTTMTAQEAKTLVDAVLTAAATGRQTRGDAPSAARRGA